MRELFKKHPHWPSLQKIVQKLEHSGFMAYLAGGAVRDALIGVTPHDFDIATDARPKDIEKLFPKALDIGKQFGIMMVPIEGGRIEIATFRSDGDYLDGRRPTSVRFAVPEEDAKRRDFTVNALFFDIKNDQVIDFVEGLRDLRAGRIRAVGDPALRFDEDKLRLLRAVRFAAQLRFSIEAKTRSAICERAMHLSVVSKERITVELEKMALAPALGFGFSELAATGLFKTIFPKVQFVSQHEAWDLFLKAVGLLAGVGSLEMVLSLLLLFEHKFGDPRLSVGQLLHHLTIRRVAQQRLEFLIDGLGKFAADPEEALILLNSDDGPLLSELGFVLGAVGLYPAKLMGETLTRFLAVADRDGRLPSPLITGHDLKNLGVTAGPVFKKILTELYKRQLRGEVTQKSAALALADRLHEEFR